MKKSTFQGDPSAASRPQDDMALGYRMPAEWEPHEGTWMAWPKDPITWPDRVPQVEKIFEEMIEALSPREKVHLLVDDEKMQEKVTKRLAKRDVVMKNVGFVRLRTVDAWIRDYGLNFVMRQSRGGKAELAMNHWIFNAWGGKYKELIADTEIPKKLEPILKVPRFEPGIVLEGGSIEVNGAGTVLTTEQCLLNPNRNPQLSREQIEARLRDYLGVRQIIWLGRGIAGDDTDGHIDDIARFVGSRTVVAAVEKDTQDENYAILQENLNRLRAARGEDGKKLEVVALPMPGIVDGAEGRLPASYANFYIANGIVLVPTYNHRNDAAALAILKELFPRREIVGIACEPLVHGFGAIHCVTQQQPSL